MSEAADSVSEQTENQRPAVWAVPKADCLFFTGRTKDYCVIVPVLNEGRRIGRLLERMRELRTFDHADILVVDGGSTDGSLDPVHLRQLGVRGLLVKTGPGKLSSQLRCAYAFCIEKQYRGLVTIDGNDKDDPVAIPTFIDALAEGVDFVQGSRFISGGIAENTPWSRNLAIRFLHAPLLSIAARKRWTDTTQGFRAYNTRVLVDSRVAPFREVFTSYELLAYLSYRVPRLGYRCDELPTARRYPKGEIPTKINGLKGDLELLRVLIRACVGGYNP